MPTTTSNAKNYVDPADYAVNFGNAYEGQAFDEEYWKTFLTNGVGSSRSSAIANSGAGSYIGAGAGANKDLEAILLSTELPGLDANTLKAFSAAKEAQMLDAEKVYTDERDKLLMDLFGKNMQRSTVAGEAGSDLLESRARTLANIEASDLAAKLGQQNILADRLQKGAETSGQIRSSFRAAQASENAAASQAAAARAMAAANVASAEISANANMATTMAELEVKRELGLGDLELKAQEIGLGWAGLDQAYWAKEGDWANAINMINEQEPSWWERVLGFSGGILSGISGFFN